jgi:hypothetical protein
VNNRIALASLVGVIAITISDAPDWNMRPYLGFLGAMTASGFIAGADQALGESMALLILGAILLRRGEALGAKASQALGASKTIIPAGGGQVR